MMSCGMILKTARKRAGLKVYEAANAIGIHPSQISEYEHERATVGPERLNALAKAYNDPGLWAVYMRAAYPSYAEHHPGLNVAEAV